MRLTGHTEPVSSCAWEAGKTRLATGSFDGTARLWNVATGEELHSFVFPARVLWVAWHPKGRFLAAALGSGVCAILDTGDPASKRGNER
jgi:WD40 repeat protein